jgi:hypothetical protein
MSVYINGIGMIAPFNLKDGYKGEAMDQSERLSCIEPDYTQYYDARTLRRMSRIVKLGTTSASMALRDASVEKPDAIIVGTGFGCLEDTSLFLRKLVQNKEEMLNPTPFIFSTHNTIASQIGLLLKSHTYNSTYSHRNFSFEYALLDTFMLVKEKNAHHALVGGIDELTDDSYTLLKRSGYFTNTAGEGSAFFVLEDKLKENSYAEIKEIAVYSNMDIKETIRKIEWLKQLQVDALFVERSDDTSFEIFSKELNIGRTINYGHLTGEYPTSNAMALLVGSSLIKKEGLKSMLIYNHYGNNHSFILLSACQY